MDEPLFRSTHAALTFAYNFQGAPALSIMNRMIKNPGDSDAPPPKGLAGLDGAAQAGMIRRHVASLGRFSEALIIAEFAPRKFPCTCRSACCIGHTPNQEWLDAVNNITDSVRTNALGSCHTTHKIGRVLVEVYFGVKVPGNKLAEILEVSENTVSKMKGLVRKYLEVQQNNTRTRADDELRVLIAE